MIVLRKNPFSDTEISISFVEGENAKQLIERVLPENGYEISDNVLDHFHVVINGLIVERDMWEFAEIKESDTVLVCPRIARGSGGQIFKQIAIIVIAVAAAAMGQAWVSAGVMSAFTAGVVVAGITVASTLALNALIPPPEIGGFGGMGGTSSPYEGSQMYTITSQSNNAKKFGSVPKVYGSHRMFPIIASTPYTEIEADPATGTLVQYYYCIFDFGFGPLSISDIKIGDTPLSAYGDAHYRLVDPNKPAVSEGPWDDVLYRDFRFYKGDVERDGTGVAIDKNQTDTGATISPPARTATTFAGSNILTDVKHPTNPANLKGTEGLEVGMSITGTGLPGGTYITALTDNTITVNNTSNVSATNLFSFAFTGHFQVVRNASGKVNGANQEITLDFQCPQGLQAYAINGNTYDRHIDLKIEFSKVGEEVWRNFNDLTYVSDFSISGGGNIFQDKFGTVAPIQSNGGGTHDLDYLGVTNSNYWSWSIFDPYGTSNQNEYVWYEGQQVKIKRRELRQYGYARGRTKIALKNDVSVNITNGDSLWFKGTRLGTIVSSSPSSVPGYTDYQLNAPLETTIMMFESQFRYIEVRVPSGKDYIYEERLYDTRFTEVTWTFRGQEDQLRTSSLSDKIYIKFRSLGAARITGNTQNPHYATIKFKPRAKEHYKVRITRVTSHSAYSYRFMDKLTLASLSTRFDRNPILTDKRHVFMEVRVRATNQLNGNISNLSAIAESILDTWDETEGKWVKKKTANPAWVFCDLLTGILNKRAIPKDRLHIPTIVEWAKFCDEVPTPPPTQNFTFPRFTCNFVLDFDTTLQSLINSVTNASQASLNIVDGKYGVLIDKVKTVPVQVFTPRNSTSFSSVRTYDDSPHGLKIRYIDPFKNWEVVEVDVYDQGYNEETATNLDELSTFACTNFEQAWRYGRYMLAQARLRKERMTIEVDFEHLVCTRGDYVQITQDVMRAGGRPARVKEVNGNRIKIDDGIDTLAGVDYGYVSRGVDGINTASLDVIDSDEFDLHGHIPAVGDLIIIGESGKVVFDCIVRSITPSDDLMATIELVEKADDIYLAESSDVLPVYDPQLTRSVDTVDATPARLSDLAVINNTWRVVGRSYEYYVTLDWAFITSPAAETYEIYVDFGKGFNLHDFTKESVYEYIVDPENLGKEHFFKVVGVSSTGKKIPLIEAPTVSATPVKKTSPPSSITSLAINITNQVIQLDWPGISDPDLSEYIIRFSSNTLSPRWEASIPLLRTDKNTTLASTQGRTGTYMIKAIDLNGNESEIAAFAITTIPNLFDLNVIDETNDFPTVEGELVNCETDGVAVMLKRLSAGGALTNEYYSEGFYYYRNFLDLGEIYTVRLQSLIEAEGFTVGDLMSEWNPLSSVTAMALAGNASWDVITQYRTTDNFNVMSEWMPLSDVDQISEGDRDNWTPWKNFVMGDATGRIFQFRLRLISNNIYVTPRVYDGVIRADMPDRLESYNNLIAPPEGLEIVYTPAFKGPGNSPNLQITQDNAQSGDYYILENKNLNGFKITFYDKNGIAVTRQFDASIKGYGRKALTVI